jgi:hypothetical protein
MKTIVCLGLLSLAATSIACGGEPVSSSELEPGVHQAPLAESTPVPLLQDQLPLPSSREDADRGLSTQATTSIVVPILLVPRGSTINTIMQTQLTQALGNVRRWYQRELPNKNLKWDTLKIMPGDYTSAEYLVNNHVWNVIPGEIERKLGWNPWWGGDVRRIALVIGRDLQGWAGANGSGGSGLAIVGLESLVDYASCDGNPERNYANPEEIAIWWCNQTVWHGTAIHELGHTFSLPHDSDPSSIMSFHGDYTNKHLVPGHAATVETNPATEPKQANWSFCSIDYQCATKRCGGNGGNRLYCLPTSAYPKYASGITDGQFCRSNSECLSGRCEMNWNGEKVCQSSPPPPSGFFPDLP